MRHGLYSYYRALCAAVIALALLAGSALAEPMATLPPAEALVTPEITPEPTPAPIPDAKIEDDGMLRVALASLGEPRQLHLTLAGQYAVDGDPGFRFDRDARVALSAASGRVYLAVGGLTVDMGARLTLTRHAADGGENGLYIDESEKEALYCGDLTVRAEGDSLWPVLTIQIEDYLCGVVAYEMSDAFPLEALKAQAVAARTYAMQRKWQAGRRDYDVMDTTADQVFKGYSGKDHNVYRAVEETRGVVGLYDGTFATCYYTASNGGQTALASQAWGQADSDGYLSMRDDPYDLENPRSLQNTLTVSAACEGSAALKEMLEAALGKLLSSEGYGAGEWALGDIAAVTPVQPRFEGSRMYDGLAFDIHPRLLAPVATPEPTAAPEPTAVPDPAEAPDPTEAPDSTETPGPTPDATALEDALAEAFAFETAEAAAEPTSAPTEAPREWITDEQTRRVTLSVYDQVKDGLSLGLNGGDYELVSVETQAGDDGAPEAFTIVMRRYGHGVGMSQRGAQWMAGKYARTWREILDFYYPGLSFERMKWPEAALTDLAALPDSVGAARPKPTPTPTPAPLPPLEAGEHYAVVNASALNVREQPTTASRALDRLPKGRRLIVTSAPDGDGWVSVRTAELAGFVKAEYLTDE